MKIGSRIFEQKNQRTKTTKKFENPNHSKFLVFIYTLSTKMSFSDLKTNLTQALREQILFKPTSKENVEKAYHMLKLGVDPLTGDNNGHYYNVLNKVIELGDLEWFKKFVSEFKFDLDHISGSICTPDNSAFGVASRLGATAILEWLIEHHNVPKTSIQLALNVRCTNIDLMRCPSSTKIAEILVKHGASVCQMTYNNLTLAENVAYKIGRNSPLCLFLTSEVEKIQKKEEFAKIKKLEEALHKAYMTIEELTEKNTKLSEYVEYFHTKLQLQSKD